MVTSILQQIKKRDDKLIEPQPLESGRVLEVRVWEQSEIIEIDLHLPFADMEQWKDVPYIKFRVDDLCFRDYALFGWDADTATCSLMIDTAHIGPGTRWARSLKSGDAVQYLAIEGTRHFPNPTALIVGLGDASSLGHLLALQQLTLPISRFEGAVLLDSMHTGQLFCDYFRSPINFMANRSDLFSWLEKQHYCTEHTRFYLAGNSHLLTKLHRVLKNLGHRNILVKEFWS